jgi:hypothetical protein
VNPRQGGRELTAIGISYISGIKVGGVMQPQSDAGMLRRKILKKRSASLIACCVHETPAGRVILFTDGC